MVEIALCLAIIGFALVAIIGVLPAGISVQQDNREETIINQDAVAWMNAIRNGALGYDDLTNYVLSVTNYWTTYTVTANATNMAQSGFDGYDRNGSDAPSVGGFPNRLPLSFGYRIIGLLSTPQIYPASATGFRSNYVVAYVRSLSGDAVDKVPQLNPTVLDSAFTYKLIVENIPYAPFDLNTTNFAQYPANSAEWTNTLNYSRVVQNLQTNSHDLRLTFRWPLLPNGNLGNGRATFRAFTGGWLRETPDFYFNPQPLFFFQPSTYVP